MFLLLTLNNDLLIAEANLGPLDLPWRRKTYLGVQVLMVRNKRSLKTTGKIDSFHPDMFPFSFALYSF